MYCNFSKIKLNSNYASKICHHKVIVSLTSFPARIDKVYLCINSLLRQSFKADKVILWLADGSVQNGSSNAAGWTNISIKPTPSKIRRAK